MKTYRTANPGGILMEEGGEYPPGTEITITEERARILGNSLELDDKGKPVIVREEKAVEMPPENKMFGKSKSTRKSK